MKPHRSVDWKRAHPWTGSARRSPTLRRQLARKGQATPHFSYHELGGSHGDVPRNLRRNARRHAWNLERLRHELDEAARRHRRHFSGITIDGGYRTVAHNREVGGAQNSRHTFADASDHFSAQVDRWVRETGLTRGQILAICDRIFKGVGDEASNTLHLDSRPGPIARFTHWISAAGQAR